MTEQPVRHTADTITDNDLDQLYAERDEARAAADRYLTNGTNAVERLHWQAHHAEQRAEQAEADRDRWQAGLEAAEAQLEHHRRTLAQVRAVTDQLADGTLAWFRAVGALRAALDEPKEPRP